MSSSLSSFSSDSTSSFVSNALSFEELFNNISFHKNYQYTYKQRALYKHLELLLVNVVGQVNMSQPDTTGLIWIIELDENYAMKNYEELKKINMEPKIGSQGPMRCVAVSETLLRPFKS